MVWTLIAQIVIAIIISIVAYAIMPKPKKQKPPAAKDMDDPTADAGRPLPVVFGSITVKGTNVLWYGEKRRNEYEIRV